MSGGVLNRATPAVVSVHDVAPQTLPEILTILKLLAEKGMQPVTLLIIPGRDWSPRDLEQLRKLEHEGYNLAGHGWDHSCYQKKSLRHKIHGALISRMTGEHLPLSREEIKALIQRCFRWFQDNDLQTPDLYVAPAWALGSISRNHLQEMPFTMYETLSGVYHSRSDSFVRLPLVGFEADTGFRIRVLKALNTVNYGFSRLLDRPLRVAIHPQDLYWGLAADLKKLLVQNFACIDYTGLNFKHRTKNTRHLTLPQ